MRKLLAKQMVAKDQDKAETRLRLGLGLIVYDLPRSRSYPSFWELGVDREITERGGVGKP